MTAVPPEALEMLREFVESATPKDAAITMEAALSERWPWECAAEAHEQIPGDCPDPVRDLLLADAEIFRMAAGLFDE